MDRGCPVSADASSLPLWRFCSVVWIHLPSCFRSYDDCAAPGRAIYSKCPSSVLAIGKIFERDFETVFVALPPPSDFVFLLAQFTIEVLFRDTSVGHGEDMACPFHLGLAHDSNGARELYLFQNNSFWDLVLSVDVL